MATAAAPAVAVAAAAGTPVAHSVAGTEDDDQQLPSSPHASLPRFDYISRQQHRTGTAERHSTPLRAAEQDLSPRSLVRPLPSPHAVRPASPYTFGTASSHASQDAQRRAALRSPASDNHLHSRAELHSHSSESNTRLPSRQMPEESDPHPESRPWSPYDVAPSGMRPQPMDDRDHDVDMLHQRRGGGTDRASLAARNNDPQFDYTMRRHSIAAVHPLPGRLPSPSDRIRRADIHRGSIGPAATHTLKRKMSQDRIIYSTLGEESESNAMAVDVEEPAPKRRGSALDTSRIAQLSLYDRRESVDSRSPVSQLWGDRRDSTSSMFSNMSSVPGYNPSGLPGDTHPKGAPPFAWTPHAGQETRNEADSSRPFDPRASSTPSDLTHHSSESRSIPTLPPMHTYAADRRMSVPDIQSKSADRSLRPKSRPPSSRDAPGSPGSPTPEPPGDNGDPRGMSSPDMGGGLDNGPHPHLSAAQGANNTPYSRSPELRVSHKLAERKRRKEMKDLFDELRDQLPADRGMKASKWEILSKAVDYIQQLKTSNNELHRDVDSLRHEVDTLRAAASSYPAPLAQGAVQAYPQAPPTAPYQVSQHRGNHYAQTGSSSQGMAAHRAASPI